MHPNKTASLFSKVLSTLFLSLIICSCQKSQSSHPSQPQESGKTGGPFGSGKPTRGWTSRQTINTKIDLLWVIDNSTGMETSQEKLRAALHSFGNRYLKSTWDIRLAVITTDSYLANPAFSSHLNQIVPGSVGFTSPYIRKRLETFQNPSWNPGLVNLTTGALDSGIKFSELIPVWGPNYARLLSGVHDGPIPSFCFEAMPYFFYGLSQCKIRDDSPSDFGNSKCLNPSALESSLSQCVNTVQNNTVHSGRAILSTLYKATLDKEKPKTDNNWQKQLLDDLRINVSVGGSGNGSERGLGSLLQFLHDNETSPTVFFRPNSLRGIIFLSDEDDQTLLIPDHSDPILSPTGQYKCDQETLLSLNEEATITGTNGLCCSEPDHHCRYGSLGISCPSRRVENMTYTQGVCADPNQLVAIEDIKTSLDSFFQSLESNSNSNPNYFVAVITPTTEAAIQTLQSVRSATDLRIGLTRIPEVARGDRYVELAKAAGSSSSLVLDLAAEDYSPLLEMIGKEMVRRKSEFRLDRTPTANEEILIKLVHADSSVSDLRSDSYTLNGDRLTFNDPDLVLSFSSTDQLIIHIEKKKATPGADSLFQNPTYSPSPSFHPIPAAAEIAERTRSAQCKADKGHRQSEKGYPAER